MIKMNPAVKKRLHSNTLLAPPIVSSTMCSYFKSLFFAFTYFCL